MYQLDTNTNTNTIVASLQLQVSSVINTGWRGEFASSKGKSTSYVGGKKVKSAKVRN